LDGECNLEALSTQRHALLQGALWRSRTPIISYSSAMPRVEAVNLSVEIGEERSLGLETGLNPELDYLSGLS
jgi:hypothetical protein